MPGGALTISSSPIASSRNYPPRKSTPISKAPTIVPSASLFFLEADCEYNSQKRPELRGRKHDFSKHSMNSLCSNSISYFVPQIASCNQRLNIASKNHISYKCLLVRNVLENYIRKHSCVPLVASERSSSASQAKRQADYRTSYSMFPLFDRKHSARRGL